MTAAGFVTDSASADDMSDDVLCRIIKRRGGVYAFPQLRSPRTAFVVVDMQQAFAGADGVPGAADLVPRVNRLAGALRHLGGRVAWVTSTANGWPLTMPEILGRATWERMHARLADPKGRQLVPGLAVDAGDITAAKMGYSAFMPGACPLPEILRALGIDTVLIGGLLTHVCCDTSARDAAMLGFRTVLIGDAMATDGPEWHQATLETFHRSFGDVRTVASAIATLTGERVAEDAAE